jgi:hypothetical protein
METNWAHFKETSWRYRNGCTRLEPQGSSRTGRPRRTWRRTIEEEITEMGKTWREVKALAKQTKRWRNFRGALCSIRN